MIDPRRLLILQELAMRGTIAGVAEALSFSPSAISQQLSALEREAGIPLLRRSGRNVVLTPQADVLVAAADEIANTLERAEAQLTASLTAVAGRVRLAVFQSAALALMPRTLRALTVSFPEVRVEMVQREPEQALHDTWARDFDLVIAEEYPAHSVLRFEGLHQRELVQDTIRLAVPQSDPSRIAELRDAKVSPWVMEPRGTASRHFAEQLCRFAGFEPDVRYETADLQTQIRLVETGNAVALMPDLVWTDRPTTCRLLALPGRPQRTILTAQRSSSSASPTIRAVRTVLEETARAMALGEAASTPAPS